MSILIVARLPICLTSKDLLIAPPSPACPPTYRDISPRDDLAPAAITNAPSRDHAYCDLYLSGSAAAAYHKYYSACHPHTFSRRDRKMSCQCPPKLLKPSTHAPCDSHKSILYYMSSLGLSSSFDTFKEETHQDEFQLEDPSTAKFNGLLEKKWTSVIRLQKKVCHAVVKQTPVKPAHIACRSWTSKRESQR